jgi:hypothetical protein
VFDDLGAQRLVALFLAGAFFFNFPLIALWDRDIAVFGVPLFPAGLFIVWGAVIALAAWVLERSRD